MGELQVFMAIMWCAGFVIGFALYPLLFGHGLFRRTRAAQPSARTIDLSTGRIGRGARPLTGAGPNPRPGPQVKGQSDG